MAKAQYVNDIKCAIKDAKNRLKRHRNLEWNEYQTRYYLIDPILEAFGWDVSDPSQVLVEDSMTTNQRPDYRLIGADSETPLAIVEAKRIYRSDIEYIFDDPDPNEDPNDEWIEWGEDEVDQLGGYAEQSGARYGVLTDGNAWAIWNLSKGKPTDTKPDPYVWAFCENPEYVSESLKILHRRKILRSFK